jgi:hypothetical protein
LNKKEYLKKQAKDLQADYLFMKALEDGNWKKWQKFVLRRAEKNIAFEERQKNPKKYYLKRVLGILLFPVLYPVIVIDNILRFFKR